MWSFLKGKNNLAKFSEACMILGEPNWFGPEGAVISALALVPLTNAKPRSGFALERRRSGARDTEHAPTRLS